MKQRNTSDSPRLHCGSVSSAGTFPSSETVEGCALTSRNSTATWLHIACGTPGGRRLMAKGGLRAENLGSVGDVWYWRERYKGKLYRRSTDVPVVGRQEFEVAKEKAREWSLQLRKGTYGQEPEPERPATTVGDWCDTYLDGHVK